MKRMCKKIAVLFVSLCLVFACVPFCAQAADAYGENVFRRYDPDTGSYVFYGDGPMSDFVPHTGVMPQTYDRIVIEAGVSYLGAYLFDGDTIGELVLPDAPLTVNANAFNNTTIEQVTFPQTAADVTQYDVGDEYGEFGNGYVYGLDLGGLDGFPDGFSFCMGDNYDLRSLVVGANTTQIPDGCCNCFGSLETLTLPDGLLTIGEGAFESCEMLQSVRIPDSVTEIGDYAFDYCTSLESLTLPKNLLTVGGWAFCTCENLTSVMIPSGATTIGESAFEDCAGLEDVHIPASVTEIGDNAFSGCSNLAYICCNTEDCYAKTYADENNIEFRLCEHCMTERVAGDASGDGVLDLRDAVLIRRYLAGGWDVTIDETASDVDGDGEVTLQDVSLIIRYLAGGWDVELV